MTRKRSFTVWVDAQMDAEIRRAAAADDRPVSAWIKLAIKKILSQPSVVPKDERKIKIA